MGDASDRIARLRLIRSESVGPATYRQLLDRFGTAEAAIEALPKLAARVGGRPPRIATSEHIERELEAVDRIGGVYLFLSTPAYPPLLAEIDTPPPALIAKGDIALLHRPTVAIVGARNASAAACRYARQLARALGLADQVIVSGLARGIDSAAHDGALETGTIAVIAGGIDIAYPPENEGRQRAIAERGLLIAEQPPGTEPRARHFPWRNRIIAGLSRGTVVVEAAPRSGSLITARHAGDYGREVMAVPGSPLDPRAQGCNLLIRDGATLVQTADDVLEALDPGEVRRFEQARVVVETALPSRTSDEEVRSVIAGLLGPTPVAIDELIRQAGQSPADVHSVLLELELAGRLERHAGGRVSLV